MFPTFMLKHNEYHTALKLKLYQLLMQSITNFDYDAVHIPVHMPELRTTSQNEELLSSLKYPRYVKKRYFSVFGCLGLLCEDRLTRERTS